MESNTDELPVLWEEEERYKQAQRQSRSRRKETLVTSLRDSGALVRLDDTQAELLIDEVDEELANPYAGGLVITGEPQPGSQVRYRRVLSRRENVMLTALSFLSLLTGGAFVGWLILAPRYPSGAHPLTLTGFSILIACMVFVELIRISQSAILGIFAAFAKDPIPMPVPEGLRVACLTTIVPGKEPLPLVMRTLRAMQEITFPPGGKIDVWLLDEGDSPEVKVACAAAGVLHFSRRGNPVYNQKSGCFKAKTKHGNHNAWRTEHESNYDIVAQMDPDHVPITTPGRDIIARCAGYFADPDTGFVVAPQVYGNLNSSWIARGAAVLCYVFHGVIQRGANHLRAPLLIGTNHVYRVKTWQQINGYSDAIIEDHLTAMSVFAARNPDTGRHWKGVYTPDIVSVGEGPTSFTDFFNQQKRWAFGIWQIIHRHSPRMIPRMSFGQGMSFVFLQQFYPSVALSWVLSNAITAAYLISGASTHLPVTTWATLWLLSVSSSLLLYFWLRRFNLVEHERKTMGFAGMGLMLVCIPTYVSAALAALRGKDLAYAVTAKGTAASPDGWGTFRSSLLWAGFAGALLAISLTGILAGYASLRLWLLETVAVCVAAPIFTMAKKRRAARSARQ